MKKLIPAILVLVTQLMCGQTTIFMEAPPYDGGTSANRAPNGTNAHAYMRACALVMQSELTSIAPNTNITAFGFTLNTGTNLTATTGNFTLYLQNTNDVTYSKGTSFATAITGMTQVYGSVMTIPTTATSSSVTITLSTPFTYTGGGIYVAYDWFSAGPFDLTAAVYRCNYLGLVGGAVTAASNSAPPATLGATNFRPCFLFGIANPLSNDIQVSGVEAPGTIPAMFNTPHVVQAFVKNASNATNTNIQVNLNVTGANPATGSQTIASLAAGASTTITFPALNPLTIGMNTISVSVPSDQNNVNNSVSYTQSVTCSEWAQNPAGLSYTSTPVGFGAASGILGCKYVNPVPSKLIGIRGAVSTNTPNVGNSIYAVLLSATGTTMAVTNAITITNGMLGTFQTFTFSAAQTLSPNTTYYLGFAQTVPFNAVAYYPAGTVPSGYVSQTLYASTALAGGAMTPITVNYGYFGIEGIFDPNTAVASSSQTVACGAPTTLSTSSTGSYTWSTGSSASLIVVSPTVNTTYSVTLTNPGCPSWSVSPVTVTGFSMPVTANAATVCATDNISLSASGAASYTWSSPTNTVFAQAFNDNPLVSTTYTVTGSNPNGCSSTNTLFMTVNPLPNVNVSSNTATVCLGGTVSLLASGNATAYAWAHGPVTASTVVNPAATTIFSVSGINNLGCTKIGTVEITVHSFTPGITSATTVCEGTEVTLVASGGTQYNWSTSSPFSSINVTPSVTTLYSVTAVGISNGCPGSNSVTVTVNANPTVTASANRTVMCKGESNVLTAGGATTYSWSNSSSTNASITVTPTSNIPYTYTVTGFNAEGCKSVAQVLVNVMLCAGIAEGESEAFRFTVYPNPSSGYVTLRFENALQNTSLKVYNTLGALVKEQAAMTENTVLDLRQEPAGVYFVQVMQNNKVVNMSKIIKE